MSEPSQISAPKPAETTAEPAKADKPAEPPSQPAAPRHARFLPLALGALGVVYGDIGTSPLYAIKECFNGPHSVPVTRENVLGVLSLVFWSLTFVVAFKYIGFILRADNKGEGGIFALLALIPQKLSPWSTRLKGAVVLLGLFGASLLYGDGMITPAISVLSAMEGLERATHAADKLVVPLTIAVLVVLFLIQKRGTDKVGALFGPVMVVWFTALTILGARYIFRQPHVLEAINPIHGVIFVQTHGWGFLIILGSVVLCVTGAEALYADMGHFGKRPIRITWFAMVFPALVVNYLGQGALLLDVDPSAKEIIKNPFYGLVPDPLIIPMVILSTMAAVIASQAMISGAFSLTRQAVQLGYFPRVTIIHTSATQEGQIFIPEVNQALGVACITLVLVFQKSEALAAAYGIAVTGTFVITSMVFYFVATRHWGWGAKTIPLLVFFLAFDVPFLAATALKFLDGGWVPILVGVGIFALLTTWKRGRAEIARRFAEQAMPLEALLEDLQAHPPPRVRGTAIFMSGNPQGTPPVLLHHLKHNQVLHRQVVLFSVLSEPTPTVPADEMIEVQDAGNGFYRVIARSGFMQTPNVPQLLLKAREHGLVCEPSTTSYFLGRETMLTSGKSTMMKWRKALFSIVSRNSQTAASYFGIPPGRVVELGMLVDL